MHKLRILITAVILIVAALLVKAHGSVLLELSGSTLKDGSGSAIANGSGRLILVASTEDATFTSPTSDTVLAVGRTVTLGSDDVILFVGTVSGDGDLDGTDDAGEFRQALNIELSIAVPAGSPLRLYWFPTLAANATSVAAGNVYGAYRSGIAEGESDDDGSDSWHLPSEGTTGHELVFETSDAGSVLHTGTSGTGFGEPEYTVAEGDGSTPSTISVTVSVDSSTESSTSSTSASSSSSTASTSSSDSSYKAKLAALKKKLAQAKRIKDPDRRKKRIAAIRAKIKALIKTSS